MAARAAARAPKLRARGVLPGVLKGLVIGAAVCEFNAEAAEKGMGEAARTQYYRFGSASGLTPEEFEAFTQSTSEGFFDLLMH